MDLFHAITGLQDYTPFWVPLSEIFNFYLYKNIYIYK